MICEKHCDYVNMPQCWNLSDTVCQLCMNMPYILTVEEVQCLQESVHAANATQLETDMPRNS